MVDFLKRQPFANVMTRSSATAVLIFGIKPPTDLHLNLMIVINDQLICVDIE